MELVEIYDPISNELAKVEKQILNQIKLINNTRSFSKEVIECFLKVPGKHLRSALILLSAGAINRNISINNNNLINLATAVELIHNASLIHDDIIDDSEKRRGKDCLNKKYNNKVAVLAGDLLYSHAFLLLNSIQIKNNNLQNNLLNIFSLTTEKMCRGEINELDIFNNKNQVDNKKYFEIIKDKTASFMSACCKTGAILSDTDGNKIILLEKFGYNFGIAYQIMDDYFDKDCPVNFKKNYIESAKKYVNLAKKSIKIITDSKYKESLINLSEFVISGKY